MKIFFWGSVGLIVWLALQSLVWAQCPVGFEGIRCRIKARDEKFERLAAETRENFRLIHEALTVSDRVNWLSDVAGTFPYLAWQRDPYGWIDFLSLSNQLETFPVALISAVDVESIALKIDERNTLRQQHQLAKSTADPLPDNAVHVTAEARSQAIEKRIADIDLKLNQALPKLRQHRNRIRKDSEVLSDILRNLLDPAIKYQVEQRKAETESNLRQVQDVIRGIRCRTPISSDGGIGRNDILCGNILWNPLPHSGPESEKLASSAIDTSASHYPHGYSSLAQSTDVSRREPQYKITDSSASGSNSVATLDVQQQLYSDSLVRGESVFVDPPTDTSTRLANCFLSNRCEPSDKVEARDRILDQFLIKGVPLCRRLLNTLRKQANSEQQLQHMDDLIDECHKHGHLFSAYNPGKFYVNQTVGGESEYQAMAKAVQAVVKKNGPINLGPHDLVVILGYADYLPHTSFPPLSSDVAKGLTTCEWDQLKEQVVDKQITSTKRNGVVVVDRQLLPFVRAYYAHKFLRSQGLLGSGTRTCLFGMEKRDKPRSRSGDPNWGNPVNRAVSVFVLIDEGGIYP